MSDEESIKSKILKRAKKEVPSSGELLSTGSTLLNLAISGRTKGGMPRGLYYHLVGDSNSGKSWSAMAMLAEASINPVFKDYKLIFDNAENGSLIDIESFFGSRLAERISSPRGSKKEPIFSTTLEEFYYSLSDLLEEEKPFIYVLDSMDSIEPEEDKEQQEREKQAHEKGKEVSGSYGTLKAKMNSQKLRVVCNLLPKRQSILVIISQTRENIGFSARLVPKTYSGGKALKFYCRVQIWMSIVEKIKKTVKGKEREVGQISQAKVTKNHVTGWEGRIEVPFYRSLGIDDIGSCVDYLVEEKHWSKTKAKIEAKEFGEAMSREDLISHIEDKSLEVDLRDLVGKTWIEIEEASKVKRKNRYES